MVKYFHDNCGQYFEFIMYVVKIVEYQVQSQPIQIFISMIIDEAMIFVFFREHQYKGVNLDCQDIYQEKGSNLEKTAAWYQQQLPGFEHSLQVSFLISALIPAFITRVVTTWGQIGVPQGDVHICSNILIAACLTSLVYNDPLKQPLKKCLRTKGRFLTVEQNSAVENLRAYEESTCGSLNLILNIHNT